MKADFGSIKSRFHTMDLDELSKLDRSEFIPEVQQLYDDELIRKQSSCFPTCCSKAQHTGAIFCSTCGSLISRENWVSLRACRNETIFNVESTTYRSCCVSKSFILRSENSISYRLLILHCFTRSIWRQSHLALFLISTYLESITKFY